MKLITFTVPCYNSEGYMRKCIDSLLVAGEEAEIIIVNDGSKDGTAAIADEYVEKYPTIVRAVHKENGGHGSGVNKGIELATGEYFKVVDSDDWLGEEALKKLMETLRAHVAAGEGADMYICNFVYEHVEDGTFYVSEYSKNMLVNDFCDWKKVKPLKLWKVFMMHSVIYRTGVLRESGLKLPEHTFYVDNLYAYQPFPYVKKLFYLNVDLYHYFIGRSDQSVTVENIVKRYDQQLRVMGLMLSSHRYSDIKKLPKRLQKIMFHTLMAIMMNTIFFTTAKDSPERRAGYKEMWSTLKREDKKLYKKIKHGTMCCLLNPFTWKVKGWVCTKSYKWLCKHVKLG